MNMHAPSRNRGFSLIEVMIAVLVLSFGLVALAALQGGLFRASAEAKARANAMAIAQNVLENARTYAFVTPPTGYKGGAYSTLANANYTTAIGGVTYTVAQAIATRAISANNEFKDVTVTVTWTGGDADAKQIQLVDSIPNVSPSDAIQVLKTPKDSAAGPQVWIVPPNKNNPTVVPIAIGDEKAAASSNPKPEQFVDDLSAATKFSVMTFTGSAAGDEVRLNRKLDVAAVSCLCSRTGSEVSSASNPAYLPTIWNGKQQAYVEPQPAPEGTKIGQPVTQNSDITPMCTVCCRDHHEAAGRTAPRPDPWRALTGSEASEEHWGYGKQGASYQIGEALRQWGTSTSATSGEYLEACQLIRVNGRFRVAVDAQQADLAIAPLNDAATGYRNAGFITNYSNYVKDLINSGVANLPGGYAAPTARFPGASAALKSTYSNVTSPATIDVTSEAVGAKRQMVGFGLYIDYLSADTREAYNCALTDSNTGNCQGLGALDPLETLPFYAVNLANLGTWTSSRPGALSVIDAQYKQGLLDSDGGIATVQTGTLGTSAQPQNIVVTLAANRSNSGLAGTLPTDPDDADVTNVLTALQNFTRFGSGSTPASRNSLFVKLTSTTTLSLKTLTAMTPATTGVVCQGVSTSDPTKNCRFESPAVSLTVSITGYTTSRKSGGTTVITDRKICAPAGVLLGVNGNGTTADTTVLTFANLSARDYTLTIAIVDEAASCPATGVSLI